MSHVVGFKLLLHPHGYHNEHVVKVRGNGKEQRSHLFKSGLLLTHPSVVLS